MFSTSKMLFTPIIVSPWQSRWIGLICFLAGFGIPVSLALQNIAAGCMLFTFICMPALWKQSALIFRHPFILVCLIFWFLFVFGLAYTPVSIDRGIWMLTKLRAYLLAPACLGLLLFLPARKALLMGFGLGALLSLLLSLWSAFIQKPLILGRHGDWQVFHTHVYHNYYIALLVCGLLALWFAGQLSAIWKIPIFLIILLGVIDIFFLVKGRTIQLIFPFMLGLLLVVWKGRKMCLPGLVLIALLVPIFMHFSFAIQSGFSRVRQDLVLYEQGQVQTSVGLRLSFYKHTLELIAQKPLLGYGTGSFPRIYETQVRGDAAILTENPHNDFLWAMAEVGIAGPLCLLGMLLTLVWGTWHASLVQRLNGLSLSISMGIATLANSFFTDNITGLGFILLACAVLAGETVWSGLNRENHD